MKRPSLSFLAMLLFTLLLVGLAMLAGCATAPPVTRVALESAPTTRVEIPGLPVPCVVAGDIPPARPTAMPLRGAPEGNLAAGASADYRQLRLDNRKMRDLLVACVGK